MSEKSHPHIEPSGILVEESPCKFYKRLLVGIIRASGGELCVPGEFFDDVEANDGFKVMPDLSYEFHLTKDWELGQDDCGHSVIEEPVFSISASAEVEAKKVVHLRVVKESSDDKTKRPSPPKAEDK